MHVSRPDAAINVRVASCAVVTVGSLSASLDICGSCRTWLGTPSTRYIMTWLISLPIGNDTYTRPRPWHFLVLIKELAARRRLMDSMGEQPLPLFAPSCRACCQSDPCDARSIVCCVCSSVPIQSPRTCAHYVRVTDHVLRCPGTMLLRKHGKALCVFLQHMCRHIVGTRCRGTPCR